MGARRGTGRGQFKTSGAVTTEQTEPGGLVTTTPSPEEVGAELTESTGVEQVEPNDPAENVAPPPEAAKPKSSSLLHPGSFVRPGTKGAKAFRGSKWGTGRMVGPPTGMRYVKYDRRTGDAQMRGTPMGGGIPRRGLRMGELNRPDDDLPAAIKRRVMGGR